MTQLSQDLEYLKQNPDKITHFIKESAGDSDTSRSPEHMFGLALALYSDEADQVRFAQTYLIAYKIHDVIQHKDTHKTLDNYGKTPESETDIELKDAAIGFIRQLKSPDNILPMIEDLVRKFKPSRTEVLDLFLDKFVALLPRAKQKELVVTKDFAGYLRETIPQVGDTKPHFLDQVLYQFFMDEFLNKNKDSIGSPDTEKSQETDITKVTPKDFVSSLLNYISDRPMTTRNIIISYLTECEKTDQEIKALVSQSEDVQKANKAMATLFLLTPLLDRIDGMSKAVGEVLDVSREDLTRLEVPSSRVSLLRLDSVLSLLGDEEQKTDKGFGSGSRE